jgi:hypothetical protein
MSANGSEFEGGYWGYADMDGRVASPISAYAAGFVDNLSGPAAQPRAFRIRSCSELEAEGTEFYTGTERLIATKEPPSSANQPGHRISPSCMPDYCRGCARDVMPITKKRFAAENALVGSVSVGNPPAASSRARSPRTCRSCRRQSSSWSSTPRPPECLASLFRRRCSRPPTR